MDSLAIVTLTALNGTHYPSERVLKLKTNEKPIQIGRASKNSTKGLSGAKDNAWFDSPVMSRNHAQLSLDPMNNTITIQDIGSMHGTYLNHSQLKANEIQTLSPNDTLIFGAEVKRGDDIFPACAFRVNYEILPSKSTSTYSFPADSSDEEEEDDCEISENSDDFDEESPFSDDDMSIESLPKASQATNPIDLTRDDSPAEEDVQEDMENSRPAENRLLVCVTGGAEDIIRNVAINPINAIILDSDEEMSTDSDDHYGGLDSDEQSLGDPYESEESGDAEIPEDIPSALSEVADSALTPSPRLAGPNPSDDHSDFWRLPPLNARTFIKVPDQVIGEEEDKFDDYDEDQDVDIDSDFGISKAGSQGLQKLREDGLLDNIEGSSFVKVGKEIVVEVLPKTTTSNGFRAEEDTHVTFASLCWDNKTPKPLLNHSVPAAETVGHTSSAPQFGNRPILPSLRQPSPSDAAMVKPAASIRVDHLSSNEWQRLTTQSLGDMTGKHEFFAARQHNRSTLNPETKSEVRLAPTTLHSTLSESRTRKRRPSATMEPIVDEVITPTFPLPEPATLPFLDDHAQAPILDRSPSPEPDMTSAVKYNESKVSMAAANRTALAFAGRSGLRINDIIDESSADHTPKDLKRKAGDISEVIEQEVRNWATSSPADVSGALTDSTTVVDAAVAQPGAPDLNAQVPDQRPTKKLRRFVERLGYAALGGAAVGAGLFSALVATAPDFL